MNKILSIFLFCICTFSLSAQIKNETDTSEVSYVFPTKYEIGGIKVTGDAFDKNIIISIAGLSTGQKINIPGDEITQAIQNLWKQNLFSDIKINLDNVVENKAFLSIEVTTRPRLSRYNFSGVNKSTANKLKEELNLSAREIVTEQLLNNVKTKVRNFYSKKGFPNATANVIQEPDTIMGKNSVRLRIEIDKGKRVKINSISFDGNEQFTDGKLRRLMKKTKLRKWYNVFRASKFLPDEYESDKEALVAFYHANGFKNAKIISDSVYKVDENLININIKLNEGNKFYFRNIVWSGNTKYDTKILNSILGIKKGDIYNPGLLESRLFINQAGLDVTSLYMDDGYLFFSLTPVETLVENDSIDMEIRIFEGPQATIDEVTVSGNTKTHDHVILRELRTKPGQKFSRSDVIRSQRELGQLGYFNPEKMNVIPTPNPKDGTVDLEYIVEEKPSDQIELSGGYGAGNIVGVLGLSLNNFSARNIFNKKAWDGYPSGDGQRLTMRAQTSGKFYQYYNISFTEPWFGGKKPNSFSISPFYSVQTNGLSSSDPNRYSMHIAGLSIGLGSRLKWPDDYFVVNQTVSFQRLTFNNYPYLVEGFGTGYSNNLYYKLNFIRQGINGLNGNLIYPNQGSIISTSVQVTPPYSLVIPVKSDATLQEKYRFIEYHKWKFDASYYQALGARKKFVIMAAANFGLIGRYNSQLGFTPFERFYVGGDGLSGFNLDGRELIRQRGYPNFNAITPQTAEGRKESGATIYDRFTFELRYPLTTSQAATIYGLGFVEAGNAWSRFKDFNPFDVKRGAGFGVRVFLPMFGLLGFDWGYGFDKTLQGPIGGSNFHIYIGQSLF